MGAEEAWLSSARGCFGGELCALVRAKVGVFTAAIVQAKTMVFAFVVFYQVSMTDLAVERPHGTQNAFCFGFDISMTDRC